MQLEIPWTAIGEEEESGRSRLHLHPRPVVAITCVRRSKTSDGNLRGLNIHESTGHNSIGYLGGIIDGRLDVLEDAGRANVTTFIDFTSSKTWLYRSRSERSAKARMCCGTLFLYVVRYAVEYARHRSRCVHAILFPSYIARFRQTWIAASSGESLCYIHTYHHEREYNLYTGEGRARFSMRKCWPYSAKRNFLSREKFKEYHG